MADNSDTGAATSQGSGEGSGNSKLSKMGKKTKIMYIAGLVLLVIVMISISVFVIRRIFGSTEKASTAVASSMVTQNLKKSAAAVRAAEGKSKDKTKKGSKDKSAESPSDTKNTANTETNNIRNVEISFSEPGSKADSNVVKKKPTKRKSGDKKPENKQDETINSGAVQLSNMLGVNDIRLVAGKASNLVTHA
ncbi:hypothetical protein NEAUS03_0261 [Nematocida ausubeli]|nr:hypothetical protein NEAUS03_0261 [Nematocida ausubeli]